MENTSVPKGGGSAPAAKGRDAGGSSLANIHRYRPVSSKGFGKRDLTTASGGIILSSNTDQTKFGMA